MCSCTTPRPASERRSAEALENARRAYGRLTLAPLPAEGSLVFAGSVEEAVAGADFVQESAPERLELKQELLAAADRAAPADAIICSSTSGLRPTDLQAGLARPERLVVGHPFNPVYLLPLVEVCGGEQTDPATVERAAAVYRSVGMHPLHVRTEIDGFVADRLLEALWREALWLVHDDVATVAEIDDAIRYGAGLRWALHGHVPDLPDRGRRRGDASFPEPVRPGARLALDEADGRAGALGRPDRQAGGAVRRAGRADGRCASSNATVTTRSWRCSRRCAPGGRAPARHWPSGSTACSTRRPPGVPAGDVDVQLHQPVRSGCTRRTSRRTGSTTTATSTRAGICRSSATRRTRSSRRSGSTADYLASGGSYFTVETHLSHLRQLRAGDTVTVTTQVLAADEKRLHLFHVLLRDGEPEPVATAEQMLLHVDTVSGRAAPAGGDVLERVTRLRDEHAALARPDRAGRSVGAR